MNIFRKFCTVKNVFFLILYCFFLTNCSTKKEKYDVGVVKKTQQKSKIDFQKSDAEKAIIAKMESDAFDYKTMDVNDKVVNKNFKQLQKQELAKTLLAKHNVALLLPLDGASKKVGKKILESCVKSLIDNQNDDIGIFVYDTYKYKNKEDICVKKIKENNCLAVVGPLLHEDIKTYYNLLGGENSIPVFALSDNIKIANKNLFPCGSYKESEFNDLFEFAVKKLSVKSLVLFIPEGYYGEMAKIVAYSVFRKLKIKPDITVVYYKNNLKNDVLLKYEKLSRADAFFVMDPKNLQILKHSTKILLTTKNVSDYVDYRADTKDGALGNGDEKNDVIQKSVEKVDKKDTKNNAKKSKIKIPDGVYFCSEITKNNEIASSAYPEIAYDLVKFITSMKVGEYEKKDLKVRDEWLKKLAKTDDENEKDKENLKKDDKQNDKNVKENKLITDSSLNPDEDAVFSVNPVFEKSIYSKVYVGENSGYYKFFPSGQVTKKKKFFVTDKGEFQIFK